MCAYYGWFKRDSFLPPNIRHPLETMVDVGDYIHVFGTMQWGCLIWINGIITNPCDLVVSMSCECGIPYGGLFIFGIFFAAGFGFLFGFLILCFPASLLFCFMLFLLLCLSASLLYLPLFFSASLRSLLLCFSAFVLYLLLFFSASLLSLLLCFCASVPFYFYYSTFSFLHSCVFAALPPAPLLLCFLSLLPLRFFFAFALFSPVCKHPRWNPKKP